MKPSELFANLKQAVEGMGEGQDKQDLLDLFQLADKQYEQIRTFRSVARYMRKTWKNHKEEIWEELRSIQKWIPVIVHKDDKKVVTLVRTDPNLQTEERR